MSKSEDQCKMAEEIMAGYRERGEPGCYTNDDDLATREVAGEPGNPRRSRLRKRCRPHGPIGFLLESMFLQAAAVDSTFQIRQWNQPDIAIKETPYQHLRPMVQQMCARNRTRDGEDAREETVGLDEIDMEATEEGIKKMQEDDRLIMDITRTGSTWTRSAAYWAGQ